MPINLDRLEELDERISMLAAFTFLDDPLRTLIELHPIRRGLERTLASHKEDTQLRTLLARALALQGNACVLMFHLEDAYMYIGMAKRHYQLLASVGDLNTVDSSVFDDIHRLAENAWLSREQFLSNAFIPGEPEPEAAFLRSLADESRVGGGYQERRLQLLKEALEIYRDAGDFGRQRELEIELSQMKE